MKAISILDWQEGYKLHANLEKTIHSERAALETYTTGLRTSPYKS